MERKINLDAVDLEEAFFARENARLLEQLRSQSLQEQQRQELSKALRVTDEGLLDHLMELNLEPATALALTLAPLAVVAWADGEIQQKEREAVLQAAADQGVEPGSPGRQLLENWLKTRPDERLITAWKRYASHMLQSLTPSERDEMRRRLSTRIRGIAEAAGGFLGLTSKISAAERAAIEDLERAIQ
jgi:hypothetical protein